MKALAYLAVAATLAGAPSLARANDWGIALQVNEGEALPPASVLAGLIPPGGTVRDAAGWHEVEKSRGIYAIPNQDWQMYQLVASVGGKNVVTLFSGNSLYGLSTFGFPVTAQQIQAFANYATYIVSNDGGAKPDARAANIPNLEAVTIWNEFNGTYNGGITAPTSQQVAMANLLNAVVPAIRAANKNVKIAAGAFIGEPSLSHWFAAIAADGFDWRTVDWLDIHPYASSAANVTTWKKEITHLRALGIMNPCYYSEWGGAALANYNTNNPQGPNYFTWFDQNIIASDPVAPAGGNYFTLSNSTKFPNEGLTFGPKAQPAYAITPAGIVFVQQFLPWIETLPAP